MRRRRLRTTKAGAVAAAAVATAAALVLGLALGGCDGAEAAFQQSLDEALHIEAPQRRLDALLALDQEQ